MATTDQQGTAIIRRAGFTLAELLVALALIALLAATLLPTVAGQLLKGDAGRVASDLQAVRSAVEQFLADVHRYPGKYSDLSKLITTSNTDILGATYPTGLTTKWKGPYVTKDTLSAVVPTGFGGNIVNPFQSVANTNGANYVTVIITGISQSDFNKIDEQLDGTSSGGELTGLLRWKTGTPDTVKFLATPIQ